MPWFSPRYLEHRNADTLLAANLAHMATILYNPNNVAYEAAPATTDMEIEVGEFAALFGYSPNRAWGHLTADGTVANYYAHTWPSRRVYEAFRAFPAANSITVDRHKMGYIPYAAGGFVARDERVLDLLSYTAPYVFKAGEELPARLGSYILEGPKPGAAAVVWVANRVTPLDVTVYGQLVGRGVEGAHRVYESRCTADSIEAGAGSSSSRRSLGRTSPS